jgi:phosphoribosylformylglycinamidine synthase
VNLRVENNRTRYTSACEKGDVVRIPIAHGEGNYFVDPATLKSLEENGQIIFRYCDPDGTISEQANPNGSLKNIAGIVNREGNVMGMMPHPERVADPLLGHTDGQKIFSSVISYFQTMEYGKSFSMAERS